MGPEPVRPARTSTRGGGGNVKKILAWLVLAFVIFYVIQAPEASAQMVRNAGTALGERGVVPGRVRQVARLDSP